MNEIYCMRLPIILIALLVEKIKIKIEDKLKKRKFK